MAWKDYQRCPGLDSTLNPTPETIDCPDCGHEIEIWSDEVKTRCLDCLAVVYNRETPINTELFLQAGKSLKKKPLSERDGEELARLACRLGATGAKIVASSVISVEDDLAGLCEESKCNHYGLSAGCPPYVGGPAEFRKFIEILKQALVFKIDLPKEILFSNDRREVGGLLQEIAANVEQSAVSKGALESKGFAGGACKNIFCRDHAECNVVANKGPCRNPQSARPSLSGFGVNVNKLMQAAGWELWHNGGNPQAEDNAMGALCGLVLIG